MRTHLYTSSTHPARLFCWYFPTRSPNPALETPQGNCQMDPTHGHTHIVMCTLFAHDCTSSAHQSREPVSDTDSFSVQSPVRALTGANVLCVRATPLLGVARTHARTQLAQSNRNVN